MKIRIICSNFLDNNNILKIGGVETYINDLSILLSKKGYEVLVYQKSNVSFKIKYSDYYVVGFENSNSSKKILQNIEKNNPDYDNDILIFSTDFLICKNKFKRSIAIQHGVAWDITSSQKTSAFSNCLSIIKGSFRAILKYMRFKNCNNIVCVDYNFINWYRTQVKNVEFNFYTVTNYAKIDSDYKFKDNEKISIVFARRLVEYRGTKLFTNSIKELLKKYENIDVTIAGTGPDEQWMRDNLKEFNNVHFTTFESKNSIEFHSKFDIAVVPTIGSEGTSLSLLEAMAASCTVIGTNVGGITNIIIDGYNGLIINPKEEELINALEMLIKNKELRKKLSQNSYQIVKDSFSYESWCEKWLNIIEKQI